MIKKITILSFVAILCTISYQAISYGTSAPPDGNTNAPVTGETNCTSCHSGSLITSGSNWGNLTLTSNFTGGGYIPDSVYTIKISMSQSGISKWGFEATVLDSAKNSMAGKLAASGGVTKSTTSSRDYVKHSSAASGSGSVSWTFTWTAPSTNVGSVKFYVCLNAADGNGQNTNDAIYAKVFTIRPSSLLPVAKASSSEATTCAGNTITINGSSTQNPKSWSWVFTGNGVSPATSNSQNPQVKYNIAGTSFLAILISKNNQGFSKPDTLKITVRSKPNVSIISPTPGLYTICKGDSVKLTATNNPNFKYTWSPGGFVTQFIWAKDTGKYTVTVTDNNNCSATSTQLVRILHHPGQTISIKSDVSNDTICFERPVNITASGSTTFDSISYYSASGKYFTTANNPVAFKFASSTDLFANGYLKGCPTPNSNKLNFVVKTGVSAPVATCTDKTTASFEISWASVTNALGYKISLDSGRTWQTPSSGNKGLLHKVLGFPPNTDVEVWLKALDVFPCNESPITKVVCGSIPCSPITYDIVWDKDACKGKEINFRIRNLTTNYFSLKIDNGKTFKDTAFTITADFSRTYKFELTDSSNLSCPSIKRDATIKVWEIPALNLTSNSPQNIFCEGFPAMFDVVSKGMQEYNFFVNTISKQKSNAPTYNLAVPKNSDSVWVTVTNGACVETSGKLKLGVKALPTAKFTYTFNKRIATFTATETGKAKFYWNFGDGTYDSTANKSTKAIADSTAFAKFVKLKVVDEFGCISLDSMEVSLPASVNNALNAYGIKIYPQPAKNSFSIELPSELINAQISLTDATGRMVLKTVADKKVTEILSADLPNGVYLIMVSKELSRINGKVIISR